MSFRKRFAPSVPLTLEFSSPEGGKESLSFRLAYNFNAFAALEARTGLNMLRGELFKNINVTNLIAMFWASLLINHGEYATDEGYAAVGEMVSLENSANILEAVKDAFMLCLPEDQRKKLKEEEATKEQAAAPLAAGPGNES